MKALVVSMFTFAGSMLVAIFAMCLSPACTKQQAVDVTTAIVNVAADVCQLAPQVLPPGTPAGSLVGLLCPLVSNPNQLVAVIVSAAGWESMKAEIASRKAKP
jgi:hypothetical protein